ncbi:MFS transporter [Synoicihabitans lomoniglobus]|uniref:MFS transporter n=1 Tax=Synoicihabitans lomoniglobus TaxID=2909285 RepID=A0AAF0CP33_9BACT|nr:MFS transporter [Opitutaceae bacterium LMO-M01]WED65345.1 MFS transporter [Opitutaceae bacterium LMO-M01]
MSQSPPTPAASPRSEHTTRESDKIGFWEKSALGTGYLANFYGTAGINSLAIPVYQMVLAVDPILLGLVLAIPRFWDALTDPIVGIFSDNLRTKWGRRKPLIVIGAITQGLAFGALWMVPEGWGQTATLIYLTVMLLLFYTCYSVFYVPLSSLTYEMTPDYKERTRVGAFISFFHKLGELTYSWAIPLAGLAFFGSMMTGVQVVGWIIGIVIMGFFGMVPGLFVKERYYKKASVQEKVHLVPAFKAAMSNRAFMVLVGLTICQVLAGMLASNLDYYIIVYHMNDGVLVDGAKWKAILSSGYAVVGILSIYPVNWLANRYGKRVALAVIFGLVLFGAFGKWFLYTPGNQWKILLDPILCGPVWTGIRVLLPSMLGDICDDDELRHGFRREGMMGALFSFIEKTGFSLAFFGTGVALSLTGFDAALGGAQSEGTILGMRLVLAVSTFIWALLALWLIAIYPLSQKRAYEIRDELEARRGRVVE